MIKTFRFRCARCGIIGAFVATGRIKAVVGAHARGWASTSISRPSAKHVCPACAPKLGAGDYPPYVRSVFAEIGRGLAKEV